MAQQEIGQTCPIVKEKCWQNTGGPDGTGCVWYRPLMLDEAHPDGSVTSREEWDCALAWPVFLHQTAIKRTRGVEAEVEAFRKNITEASPDSPMGIIALSFSSLAQSVARTIEHKSKNAWQRWRDRARPSKKGGGDA